MIFTLKKIITSIFPKSIIDSVKLLPLYYDIKCVQRKQKNVIKAIRKKEKIRVVFFLIFDSVWKYEGVYHLMLNSKQFEPMIVVCPYIKSDESTMFREMNKAYSTFKEKGYNVINSYNKKKNEWLDVKKILNPDIVFFSNPHKLTKDEYYINHYTDRLTCYVPYNFGNSHLYQMMHNQLFHNYLWRLFAETPTHKEFSVKYAINKGKNVKVTGFPGTDVFLDKNYEPQNCWKHKSSKIKRIIWAPHHTIDNNTSFLSYSSFLIYSEYMLKLTDRFDGKIQIAFKPHPLLFNRLSEESCWGKEKTLSYYNCWKNLEYGQLVEGDYVDLFLTSDAMMHDSGSFLIEYLYTGKPVLYLDRDEKITERMNAFGIRAFDQHYHAKNESDIENFIESVLNNEDIKKTDREKFLTTELLPPNQKSASENLLDEIIKELNLKSS